MRKPWPRRRSRSAPVLPPLADASRYLDLKTALANTGIECAAGPDAVAEAARRPSDLVIGAIAGTAGMMPTFAAIEAGRTIALANKETLVCAGTAVMEAVARHGATFASRWTANTMPSSRPSAVQIGAPSNG